MVGSRGIGKLVDVSLDLFVNLLVNDPFLTLPSLLLFICLVFFFRLSVFSFFFLLFIPLLLFHSFFRFFQ